MNRFPLVFIVMSLVSSVFAIDTPAKPDQPALCGGYSPAEIDSEVRKVAEFAVKTQAEATGRPLQLVKILKSERQVVAGLNFRIEIEVADGSKRLIRPSSPKENIRTQGLPSRGVRCKKQARRSNCGKPTSRYFPEPSLTPS